jgi:hypothetical protein
MVSSRWQERVRHRPECSVVEVDGSVAPAERPLDGSSAQPPQEELHHFHPNDGLTLVVHTLADVPVQLNTFVQMSQPTQADVAGFKVHVPYAVTKRMFSSFLLCILLSSGCCKRQYSLAAAKQMMQAREKLPFFSLKRSRVYIF